MIIEKEKTTGIFFSIVGLIFVFLSLDYNYGSLHSIGPGFLPRWIGILIFLIGLYTIVKNFSTKNITTFFIKEPSLLIASIFVIPLVYYFFGILLAVSFMIIISSSLDSKFSIKNTLIILVFLILFLVILQISFFPSLKLL
jgi:hypothetical protein